MLARLLKELGTLINLLTTNTLNWVEKQVKKEDEANGRKTKTSK